MSAHVRLLFSSVVRLSSPNSFFAGVVGQINVGKLDPVSGTFTGESDVYALAGYLRGRVRGVEIPIRRTYVFVGGERDGSRSVLQSILGSVYLGRSTRLFVGEFWSIHCSCPVLFSLFFAALNSQLSIVCRCFPIPARSRSPFCETLPAVQGEADEALTCLVQKKDESEL